MKLRKRASVTPSLPFPGRDGRTFDTDTGFSLWFRRQTGSTSTEFMIGAEFSVQNDTPRARITLSENEIGFTAFQQGTARGPITALDDWHHVFVQRHGSVLRFWVDGKEIDNTRPDFFDPNNSPRVAIQRMHNQPFFFTYLMNATTDETFEYANWQVFTRQLTGFTPDVSIGTDATGEIGRIYNDGAGVTQSELRESAALTGGPKPVTASSGDTAVRKSTVFTPAKRRPWLVQKDDNNVVDNSESSARIGGTAVSVSVNEGQLMSIIVEANGVIQRAAASIALDTRTGVDGQFFGPVGGHLSETDVRYRAIDAIAQVGKTDQDDVLVCFYCSRLIFDDLLGDGDRTKNMNWTSDQTAILWASVPVPQADGTGGFDYDEDAGEFIFPTFTKLVGDRRDVQARSRRGLGRGWSMSHNRQPGKALIGITNYTSDDIAGGRNIDGTRGTSGWEFGTGADRFGNVPQFTEGQDRGLGIIFELGENGKWTTPTEVFEAFLLGQTDAELTAEETAQLSIDSPTLPGFMRANAVRHIHACVLHEYQVPGESGPRLVVLESHGDTSVTQGIMAKATNAPWRDVLTSANPDRTLLSGGYFTEGHTVPASARNTTTDFNLNNQTWTATDGTTTTSDAEGWWSPQPLATASQRTRVGRMVKPSLTVPKVDGSEVLDGTTPVPSEASDSIIDGNGNLQFVPDGRVRLPANSDTGPGWTDTVFLSGTSIHYARPIDPTNPSSPLSGSGKQPVGATAYNGQVYWGADVDGNYVHRHDMFLPEMDKALPKIEDAGSSVANHSTRQDAFFLDHHEGVILALASSSAGTGVARGTWTIASPNGTDWGVLAQKGKGTDTNLFNVVDNEVALTFAPTASIVKPRVASDAVGHNFMNGATVPTTSIPSGVTITDVTGNLPLGTRPPPFGTRVIRVQMDSTFVTSDILQLSSLDTSSVSAARTFFGLAVANIRPENTGGAYQMMFDGQVVAGGGQSPSSGAWTVVERNIVRNTPNATFAPKLSMLSRDVSGLDFLVAVYAYTADDPTATNGLAAIPPEDVATLPASVPQYTIDTSGDSWAAIASVELGPQFTPTDTLTPAQLAGPNKPLIEWGGVTVSVESTESFDGGGDLKGWLIVEGTDAGRVEIETMSEQGLEILSGSLVKVALTRSGTLGDGVRVWVSVNNLPWEFIGFVSGDVSSVKAAENPIEGALWHYVAQQDGADITTADSLTDWTVQVASAVSATGGGGRFSRRRGRGRQRR